VPFGAYKREVFSKVGFFDEHLVRNQDNELNSRISKSGGKIYLTPDLAVHYYNQATVSGLLKQAFKTGMWNVVTLKINPSAFRWRHFIPFIFVTTVLLLIILAPLHTWVQFLLLVLVGLYGSAALFSSLQIGFRKGIKYAIILPMFFFLYHICYGLGTWAGLIKSMYNWLGNLIK
jgi:GT2 family glycosyltransferase